MTLWEKSVPYCEHDVNIGEGENLHPDYMAINLRALVPTVTFGNRSIFDSATIMRFANNRFPGPELSFQDSHAFEAMNRWIDHSVGFPIRGFTYRAHLASGLPDYWRVGMRDNIIRAREHFPERPCTCA